MPKTSKPRLRAVRVTARRTALRPGASPPPVLTAIRSLRATSRMITAERRGTGRLAAQVREHRLEGGGVAAAQQLVDGHLRAGHDRPRRLHAPQPDFPVLGGAG